VELARHNRRINNTVRLGKLTLASNEIGIVQTLQIQLNAWELMDNVHSLQAFGLASALPIGTDTVILNLSGDKSNAVVIATGHNQFRPLNMAPGETQIYDNAGQRVYLSQTGGVLAINITAGQKVIITAATSVDITAPNINITGNLHVTGTIQATGDISSGTVTLDTHRHSGVQTGSGTSGFGSG
jgi:phage baseplate assembly protein V